MIGRGDIERSRSKVVQVPKPQTLSPDLQVRLLDFNPVGGTTSPLLFSWEQLGYAVALATAEPQMMKIGGMRPALSTEP